MATQIIISSADMSRYREIIGEMDINDEQKDDVIRVVHSIMQAFVDISYSNDPVQLSVESRLSESFRNSASCGTIMGIEQEPVYPAVTDTHGAGLEPG